MEKETSAIIQRRQPKVDFNLQRMEDIFELAKGKTDLPHRHDYYTVLFVEKGKGKHIIDFQVFPFQKLEVHFVSPGQVHQVALTQKPKGWVLTFSKAFLAENNIQESFISNINLFHPFGDSPPLEVDEETFERLLRIITEMESCIPLDLNYRNRALGALLQLFLIYCNNSRSLNTTQLEEENASVCILRDFKNLVETKYVEWHKVSNYASQIHISPKHLSQTVKNFTGITAKEVIQDRLLLEAKRLLLHTDLNIKDIAYKIGFEEPLHFSGFFKRKAERSPSEFRKEKR